MHSRMHRCASLVLLSILKNTCLRELQATPIDDERASVIGEYSDAAGASVLGSQDSFEMFDQFDC